MVTGVRLLGIYSSVAIHCKTKSYVKPVTLMYYKTSKLTAAYAQQTDYQWFSTTPGKEDKVMVDQMHRIQQVLMATPAHILHR